MDQQNPYVYNDVDYGDKNHNTQTAKIEEDDFGPPFLKFHIARKVMFLDFVGRKARTENRRDSGKLILSSF